MLYLTKKRENNSIETTVNRTGAEQHSSCARTKLFIRKKYNDVLNLLRHYKLQKDRKR